MKISDNLLNNYLNDIIGKKYVFSTVLRVETGDGSFTWEGSRGEMKQNSKYFIASVTKLYVTAIIMSLIEEQKLCLDDKITKYLPSNYFENIHILKGVDYSNDITIKHLVSNTSGLPDYFNHSAFSSLLQGNDDSWNIERTIRNIKNIKPNFTPGKKGKVAYSDTNYQLLGKIIEIVTGKNINRVFDQYIFDKLGLSNSYVYHNISDNEPVAFYYKAKKLWLPKYMASISCEGGIVSTAHEVMAFLYFFMFYQCQQVKDI